MEQFSAQPSATGETFERELTEFLRARTRLMLWVVLVVTGIAIVVYGFLFRRPPALQGGLSP
ncbi:MAG: hypothetical protein JSV86_20810 [Gemmatimonadota bacterium]|nr:MAG: hypothetical protein JSV86_20810 [Gemmatimonadota bacterium]